MRPATPGSAASPPTSNSPVSGLREPPIMFLMVDLPAPFSPASATTSPGAMSNDTSRTAETPPNDLLSRRRLSAAVAVTTRCTLPVSYTHLRAHETRHDLVCRLL